MRLRIAALEATRADDGSWIVRDASERVVGFVEWAPSLGRHAWAANPGVAIELDAEHLAELAHAVRWIDLTRRAECG